MDKCEIDEIIACLPSDRTQFRYFKDAYVILLLGQVAGDGITITELRRSPFNRLLTKPAVRGLLASCGDGTLDRSRLLGLWREPSLPFLLSLGSWGGMDRTWQQTSRPGWNLVLRLNFVTEHDARFHALYDDESWTAGLNYSGHPILRHGERSWYRETLAWARLDLDFARGQALIEEIQSDWISYAGRWRRRLLAPRMRSPEQTQRACRRLQYLDQVLAPYAPIWDEAMLSATLGFLLDELGFREIWYHSWHCGVTLKGIDPDRGPPRSLYTDIPRRFCFELITEMPAMLNTAKRRTRLRRAGVEPRFFRLRVDRTPARVPPPIGQTEGDEPSPGRTRQQRIQEPRCC